jgi:PAS domain S-box-containing protein
MISGSIIRSFIGKYWPVLTIIAIIILGLLNLPLGGSTGLGVLRIISLVAIYFSTAIIILTSSPVPSKSIIHRSWAFVSIGLILLTLAYVIEAIYQLFSSTQLPVPSLVDLARYAGLIGIVGGFAAYPETQKRIFGRIRALLDIGILAVGVVIVFWMVVLRPILQSGLEDTITAVWIEGTVCFDLICMVLLLRLFLNAKDRNESTVFLLFGLGSLLQTAVDLFSGFTKINIIQPAPGTLEMGWMASGLLFLYGSSYLLDRKKKLPALTRIPKPKVSIRLGSLLPAVITYIIIGFVALDWFLVGKLDKVVLPILFLMAILLIARQGVIVGQSEIRQHAELVNSTTDFAFTFDSKGTVRLANPTLQIYLGANSDSKLLSNVSDFLRVHSSLEKILSEASESGWSGEAQFFSKDGETLPVSLSIKLIQDEKSGQQLFAAIAHDLTETKIREEELRTALRQLAETEEDLRRLNRELEAKVETRTQALEDMVSNLAQLNEELKALDQLKSDFVALVSHELRAPLTNIRTGLEVLLRGEPEISRNARDSLQLILKETERLSSFVEMILDLSALEAGKLQLNIHPISVAKIIEEAVQRFSTQDGHDRIQIELPNSAASILADERALHSILFHLIDNSLKYAPEGDVLVKVSNEESEIRFNVIDSGPGIPEGEHERVFEMFYRLDTSDSRQIYGRGLGLNLAKRFLDLMGGGIRIMDNRQVGTQIEFWLPASSATD